MPRLTLMILLCATLVGSARADPIVGVQEWEFDGIEVFTRFGPTLFGNLPEPGRIIEEVASRADTYFVNSLPNTITLATPDYAGGPAPMSDVFFSVNVEEVFWVAPDWWLSQSHTCLPQTV